MCGGGEEFEITLYPNSNQNWRTQNSFKERNSDEIFRNNKVSKSEIINRISIQRQIRLSLYFHCEKNL